VVCSGGRGARTPKVRKPRGMRGMRGMLNCFDWPNVDPIPASIS
jgi:hypothetical protein